MQLFYSNEIIGRVANLPKDEAMHCLKVLRHKLGDELTFIDGKGGLHKGKLVEANLKKCSIEISESIYEFGKRSQYLHIAIAPTKNMDRLEWFVEKAVEIGVEEISLIASNRTERSIVKVERLEKIALSAAKQSLKAYVPIINPMIKFKEFIKKNYSDNKYIAHLVDENRKELKDEISNSKSNLILIGPEGDFTVEEVKEALKANFVPVALGQSRLRTETAAMYACAVASIIN